MAVEDSPLMICLVLLVRAASRLRRLRWEKHVFYSVLCYCNAESNNRHIIFHFTCMIVIVYICFILQLSKCSDVVWQINSTNIHKYSYIIVLCLFMYYQSIKAHHCFVCKLLDLELKFKILQFRWNLDLFIKHKRYVDSWTTFTLSFTHKVHLARLPI